MKKSITLIIALLCAFSAYAQINITDKGRLSNLIIAADLYCCVIKNDNSYELRVSLQNTTGTKINMIILTLGPDEKSAIKSLSQIEDWMDKAAISEYLIIEQNGDNITLYKSHANRFMISSGDQYYCKQIMTSIATGWDTPADIPYGYCTNVVIKKALKTLNTLD